MKAELALRSIERREILVKQCHNIIKRDLIGFNRLCVSCDLSVVKLIVNSK